jgi:rubrerythrin
LLSKIPINLEKIRKEDLNKENLRAAIIAELDAVNLYEQMAVGFYKKGVIVKACGFLSGLS